MSILYISYKVHRALTRRIGNDNDADGNEEKKKSANETQLAEPLDNWSADNTLFGCKVWNVKFKHSDGKGSWNCGTNRD